MANLVALIFVLLVIVLGIGACWAITANGAASTTPTDTFGNKPSTATIAQNNASSGVAVASMPMLFIGFFVMVCIILVASIAWLWKTGKSKPNKY